MAKSQYDFVIDCSIAMAWCFEDERSEYTDAILEKLGSTTAIVPALWPLEVSNVLLMACKKQRITESVSARFLDALSQLPIVVDHSIPLRAMQTIYMLAAKDDLTIYDASYLELALREEIPLITLDKKLIKVAKSQGILFKLS